MSFGYVGYSKTYLRIDLLIRGWRLQQKAGLKNAYGHRNTAVG